ncbi:MAG: tRNA ((37)-N6)-dimethylallyltransferase MiaA [Pseudomonadota bacterium]
MNLARQLAQVRGIKAEIVGCDSVQVYRDFNIGSAKPSLSERSEFPHHLIDVVSWHEDFDAGRYATLAHETVSSIRARGALPILVGGTGLYLRAFLGQGFEADLPKDETLRATLQQISTEDLWQELESLDPARAAQLHPNDRVRILRAVELCRLTGKPVSAMMSLSGEDAGRAATAGAQRTDVRQNTLIVFLNPDRAGLHERIAQRVDEMLASGLVEEVRGLLAAGCPLHAKPMQAIGYREVAAALQEQSTKSVTAGLHAGLDSTELQQVRDAIVIATRQYAKRQITWFKGAGPDIVFEALDSCNQLIIINKINH